MYLAEPCTSGLWMGGSDLQCQSVCKVAWHDMVWHGVARQGVEWQGLWRQGKDRKGMLFWIVGNKKPRTARLSGLYEGWLTGSYPGQADA